EYGVKRIIRVGTCGALAPDLEVGKLVLATHAHTDSGVIATLGVNENQPPNASENLATSALKIATRNATQVVAGPVFSTDLFYADDKGRNHEWSVRGILAVEMETSVLYALASLYKVEALTLLTVSDNLATRIFFNSEEREKAGDTIMRIALDTLVETPFG